MYARWLGVLLCLLLIHPAEAAVHRCVDAQGKTYYSDSACPMASGARREQPQDAPVPETTRPAGRTSYAQRTATAGWALQALLATDRRVTSP